LLNTTAASASISRCLMWFCTIEVCLIETLTLAFVTAGSLLAGLGASDPANVIAVADLSAGGAEISRNLT